MLSTLRRFCWLRDQCEHRGFTLESYSRLLDSDGSRKLLWTSHQHKGGFETVINIELVKDVGQMGFDGLFTDEYFLADLLIGKPFGHQSQNFHLTLSKGLNALI